MEKCSTDVYSMFRTLASYDKVCRQTVGSFLFTHFIMNS